MKKSLIDKIFIFAKSNNSGYCINKIYLSDLYVDTPKKDSALYICEENLKDLTNIDLGKFNLIILNEFLSLPKKYSNKKLVWLPVKTRIFNEGDVVEIYFNKIKTKINILYRFKSNDNVLILTNACNNKCIMCPEPVLKPTTEGSNIKKIERIIKLISKSTKFLAISGGEPTITKDKFICVLSLCKKNLPNTEISVISNGRMFFYKSFVDEIESIGIKNLLLCIALHSYDPLIHDKITQIPESHNQTLVGLKNLLNSSINIELRIVLQQRNYKDLNLIADFIINNLKGIYRVAFLGMEMSGSARLNKNNIWIELNKIRPYLQQACIKLLNAGIKVNIFNIPFCKVDKSFYPLCAQSISDYKIRYLEKCDRCIKKNECGGIFASTRDLIKNEDVNPINGKN